MNYSITNKKNKEWQDKSFVEATLTDINGDEFVVSAWRGEFDGETFDGELEKSEKGYWRIKKPTTSKKPNFDRIIEKKQAGIAEAQSEKAKNIALAQDRSAWMWAKTNASTLLGTGAGTNNDEIAERVLDLATKIYNGEPNSPFN